MPCSEVSQLARRWLESHGDDAVALARDMIAELEASENATSADMWRQIVIAIEKLRTPINPAD
jgi:hypothetical protein